MRHFRNGGEERLIAGEGCLDTLAVSVRVFASTM